MKKILCALLVGLMLCAPLTAFAAQDAPEIIVQPMNYVYGENNSASYNVLATGSGVLSATWYIVYNGKTYNTLEYNEKDPWRAFAGASYGPMAGEDGRFNFFFQGIEKGLDGAEIYCVIEDGHYDVKSERARITVADNAAFPPPIDRIEFEINDVTVVSPSAEVNKGDSLWISCKASPAHPENNEQITWTWYESTNGKLDGIKAISDGPEYSDNLIADTSKPGTRYYYCMVESSTGGRTYSNRITVTVRDTGAPASSSNSVQPPKLAQIALPDAEVGEDYGFLLTCSDLKAEFSISYNPGKANDFDKTGLSLTKTGVITGVPTKEGTYTFTVCASNAGGEDYMTYTLKVNPKTAEAPIATAPQSSAADTSAPAASAPAATVSASADPSAPQSSGSVDSTEPLGSTIPQNSGAAASTPAPTEPGKPAEGLPSWVIAVIAAAAAACIAVAVTLLVMKRRKV